MGGITTTYISLRRLPMERKTANATAAATLTGAATDLIYGLQEEMSRLEEKVTRLEKADRDLRDEITTLRADLRREVESKQKLSKEVAALTKQNVKLVEELHQEREKRRRLEEKLDAYVDGEGGEVR